MLLKASGECEHVRVEDDVFRREIHGRNEQFVGAFADFDLPLIGVSLTFFIERHHHRSGAVPAQQARLTDKILFAFFHRN